MDSVLCTLFIFGVMGLFSSVTYFRIFDLFDPIGEMFSDFELSDLVMSQLRAAPDASEDIVLVNIGFLDREGMAAQIDIINDYNPVAIGLDAYLGEFPSTYSKDSLLIEVIKTTPNLVIGDKLLDYNEHTDQFDSLLRPEPRITDIATFGHVNLLTQAANQNDLKSCREWLPQYKAKGMMHKSFAVKLVEMAEPEKAKKFLDRGNEIEGINFKGNAVDYGQTEFGTRYFTLDYHDIFEGNFTPDLFENKIVVLCFMGSQLGDQETRIDRYFTPLNKNYVGKAEPDMWGGVVHANAISMILEEDYIDSMSQPTSIFLAVSICLFNVLLFKVFYGAIPKWYDGITKVIQLIQVLGLVSLMILLFHWFSYKADFTLALAVIALSGDSIEVYHGVIKNLFSKEDRKDLFRINRGFLKNR